ncbi:MAG TPA: PP2C family protein-serine/threonine phosphatase, partial [Terracidiphilus sp.]|nr:PP2C family protein-serine/threonine phosphatase [Terracidiphilus sp.]
FIYWKRRFPDNWLLFLLVVAIVLPPVYFISSVAVWWFAPPTPQQPLSQLLRTEWKFPIVATWVFSLFSYLYRATRDRLECRNRELESSVKQGAAQLELQQQELQRAREIQQSLLPKEIPRLAGFEVAGAWRPARTVSGDYFDVVKLNDHKLGICIADVAGKGISAALLMANVQAAVRTLAAGAASPAELCDKVNNLLHENVAVGKFVTFLYGVLDGETRTLVYCNAGHLFPILISHGTYRMLDGNGAVLGVFPSWHYENTEVQLDPGDRILFFTDGITEAMDSYEREFGESSLGTLAQAYASCSASALNSLLLDKVSSFCGAHFHDDATLLVIAAK